MIKITRGPGPDTFVLETNDEQLREVLVVIFGLARVGQSVRITRAATKNTAPTFWIEGNGVPSDVAQ